MASEVSICNLALSMLGDEANIASIDPAEDSAQAEHCQRYYPIARNTVLESHEWNFATRRIALVELDIDDEDMPPGWSFCYQRPNECLKVLAVISPVSGQTVFTLPPAPDRVVLSPSGSEGGEEFVEESRDDDVRVIYTNAEEATLKYIALVEDTTKFSALFVNALARLLASMLAGPIIKGEVGMKIGAAMLTRYEQKDLPLATKADARARKLDTYNTFVPSGIAARR